MGIYEVINIKDFDYFPIYIYFTYITNKNIHKNPLIILIK
jgi:hypothetical protein